jgi:hypothetical protein
MSWINDFQQARLIVVVSVMRVNPQRDGSLKIRGKA